MPRNTLRPTGRFIECITELERRRTTESDSDRLVTLYEECLLEASSFGDFVRVYNATFVSGEQQLFERLGSVRKRSLQRLINAASTRTEAEEAVELASRRLSARNIIRSPASLRRAKARLAALQGSR